MINAARVISHCHHAHVSISPFQLLCRLSFDSRGKIRYALFKYWYNPIHFVHAHYFYLDFFFFPCLCTLITRANGSIIIFFPLRYEHRTILVLTYGIPPEFRCDVHLYIEAAIRYRAIPESIGSCSCVLMALTAESTPAREQ